MSNGAVKACLLLVYLVIGANLLSAGERGPAEKTAIAEASGGGEGGEPSLTQDAAVPSMRVATKTIASPSRPTWTGGASTSDRGEIQADFGWQWQSMGDGVQQTSLPASMRYGLTDRIELRWGMPGHMAQSGGGTAALKGISDQSVSALYRVHEQGRWLPAFAFSYGIKIPSANPSKGFGTGYVDNQVAFVASRDMGKVHVDFNTVGTIVGTPYGHDGATTFGLALSLPITERITWMIDSYGGAQPGTRDRYGAELMGFTWAIHPWLVLDGAYTRAYTAGAPRQQFTFGMTHAMKPGLGLAFRRARVSRLLGH